MLKTRLLTLYFFTLFNTYLLCAEPINEVSLDNLDGTVEGQLKLFYYDIHKETDEDAYATSLGGYLMYTTDTNEDLYGSVRFHNSTPITNYKNKQDTQLFNEEDAGTLSVLSESYLALHDDKQELKVGNMMLSTPMMNDDVTRTVPWSYQGVTYSTNISKHSQFQLYYINQLRSHTSDEYKKESASGEIGSSGITMLNLKHNDGSLTLNTYYYYAPDLYSTFIAQSDYKLRQKDETFFCFGAQYFNSGDGGKYAQTENKNGGDDIDLLAFRVGYNTQKWIINLNYSQNFGLSGIVKGYGGLAKVYTTSMVANGRGNYKPETWMFKYLYNLDEFKWGQTQLALWLTNTRVKDSRGNDFDAYYMHLKHNFDVTSSVYIRYENIHYKNAKSDVGYFRVISEYKF